VKDYVPLIETGLWVLFATGVLIAFWRPLTQSIKAGSSFKIGGILELGGISQRMDNVEQQVNDLSDKVSKLFLYTMSGPMFLNLRKLASGNFGEYEMGDALKRELYHLRDIGYIHVESIRDVLLRGENLSRHVSVTPAGLQFVELRESQLAGDGQR
jgi:hypothetical protein